jgi:SAM-dependent methyltransferase
MAEKVGKTGRVVGIDIDGNLGHEGLSALLAMGHTQCAFVEGDVWALERIESSRFDLVFGRLVVEHMDDPISGLKQMYRWVKPGGSLVIQDHCHPVLDADPFSEVVTEINSTFAAVWKKVGREPRTGIKLPAYFIKSGIGAPDGTDVAGDLLSMRQSAAMGAAVYRSLLPLALKLGITTEERSRQIFELASQAQNDDDSYVLWPLIISVWKRKPAE